MCFVYVISLYKSKRSFARSENKDYAFFAEKRKIKERERERRKEVSLLRALVCTTGHSYTRTLALSSFLGIYTSRMYADSHAAISKYSAFGKGFSEFSWYLLRCFTHLAGVPIYYFGICKF